jgi:hypothetical protein
MKHLTIIIAALLVGCAKHHDADPATPIPVSASHSSLSVKSFRFIGPSTTIQQVIDKVGSPGGGLVSLTFEEFIYHLNDGTDVRIGVSTQGQGILGVIHQTAKGQKIEVIYEKKQPAA